MNDTAPFDGPSIDGFFGDEEAAEETAQIDVLRHRVVQVEAQINSQFTSLATYAQIAQEQIELARAEARASTERTEQRLTALIDRERADRLRATGAAGAAVGVSTGPSSPAIEARLDALEQSVTHITTTLEECFTQQKALADAINRLFDARPEVPRLAPPTPIEGAPLAPPAVPAPRLPSPDAWGPIPQLSMRRELGPA